MVYSGFVRDCERGHVSIAGGFVSKDRFVVVVCPDCKRTFRVSKRKRGGKHGKGKYEIPVHTLSGKPCSGEKKVVES